MSSLWWIDPTFSFLYRSTIAFTVHRLDIPVMCIRTGHIFVWIPDEFSCWWNVRFGCFITPPILPKAISPKTLFYKGILFRGLFGSFWHWGNMIGYGGACLSNTNIALWLLIVTYPVEDVSVSRPSSPVIYKIVFIWSW